MTPDIEDTFMRIGSLYTYENMQNFGVHTIFSICSSSHTELFWLSKGFCIFIIIVRVQARKLV